MSNKPLLKAGAIRMFLYAILAWLPLSVWAVTLKNMDATTLPGDVVELRLLFDGPAPEAEGYTIEQPPRISLDLPYTQSDLPKYNEIGFENAKSVTALEAGDRTRLVINLKKTADFSTQTDGNVLYIYVGTQNTAPYNAPASALSAVTAPEAEPDYNGITKIDFQRGEEGEGNVLITLANPDIPMDINEMGGRIRLEFQGNVLPDFLRNRLDVIDFATPVKFIDAREEEGNGVIVIEPTGKFDYLAYQTDNTLTVSVKPATESQQRHQRNGLSYKGEKLSLNFQDIEVRAVLQLIADFTDLNLVASDTVTGNVTLRLQDVPWDQALDIVLKSKGLDKRLESNVLTVAPAQEIASREREQLENKKQIRELAPVYTDLIQINYADAADIAKVLSGKDENTALLTNRGSVQVVKRTNSLLVKDTQNKLDELRTLIGRLDIPVRQVMIEARIVSVSSKLQKDLGVKWKLADQDEGTKKQEPFVDFGQGTNSAATNLNVGFAVDSVILNLELDALLSDGGGENISQPKVITADKKTAMIKSGTEIPYEEKTSSGATSVAFKDAALSLEVTPQITPEGSIIMDVKVTNDAKSTETVNGVPIIDKNEVKTQVLVQDGETVVLGGVFTKLSSDNVSKVPFFGDLPVVGHLFKSTTKKRDKTELLIFITPRVINDQLTLR